MEKIASEKQALALIVCMTFSFSFCIPFLKFMEKPMKNKNLRVKKNQICTNQFSSFPKKFLGPFIHPIHFHKKLHILRLVFIKNLYYTVSFIKISSSRIISHNRLQSKICPLKHYRRHFSDGVERSRIAGSLWQLLFIIQHNFQGGHKRF